MDTSRMSGKPNEMGGGGGVTYDGQASHPAGEAILLVSQGNWDKLPWCGPLGLCARLYLYFIHNYYRLQYDVIKLTSSFCSLPPSMSSDQLEHLNHCRHCHHSWNKNETSCIMVYSTLISVDMMKESRRWGGGSLIKMMGVLVEHFEKNP